MTKLFFSHILKPVLAAAFLGAIWLWPAQASAATDIYFFYGEGCPHCAKEELYLDYLEKTRPGLEVHRYEVWSDKDNAELLNSVAEKLKLRFGGVPVTVVGTEAIVGFDEAETTGRRIEALLDEAEARPGRDAVAEVLAAEMQAKDVSGSSSAPAAINSWFGKIDPAKLSLPALTIAVGLLDSLNPCALWVLLFLLSLLLAGGDRRRLWVLGSGFILASAGVYFLFLSAWLNVYLLIGLLKWLKLSIIAVAIGAGIFNLRAYWRNRRGGCDISEAPKKRAILDRLKRVANQNSLFLSFVGVVALAASINLVELLCSAGLPAIYVPVLVEAGLAQWQYYAYLLLYVFCYVLIQIVIFLIASLSLRLTAVSSKITKWSNLVGGIIMVILGLWLILQWY